MRKLAGGLCGELGPGVGVPLHEGPERVSGNLTCKVGTKLVNAGTLEFPPSQLGKHILETSGGLGRVKAEGSDIQKGDKSDSFFLFPSLHLSRGLVCPPSVLLGLGDPGPLGISSPATILKDSELGPFAGEGGREGSGEGGRGEGYWEGKGHRPKFLGSCSFSHSEKQRNRKN